METGVRVIPYNYKMRNARKRLGLTQRDLAELVNTATSYISSIERWTIPSEELARDIACVLGLHTNDIRPDNVPLDQLRGVKPFDAVLSLDNLNTLDAPTTTLQLPEESATQAINDALSCLDKRSRKILELKFGLYDGHCYTQEQIAQRYHITTARVHQIVHNSLRKLRHPLRLNPLRKYLTE